MPGAKKGFPNLAVLDRPGLCWHLPFGFKAMDATHNLALHVHTCAHIHMHACPHLPTCLCPRQWVLAKEAWAQVLSRNLSKVYRNQRFWGCSGALRTDKSEILGIQALADRWTRHQSHSRRGFRRTHRVPMMIASVTMGKTLRSRVN